MVGGMLCNLGFLWRAFHAPGGLSERSKGCSVVSALVWSMLALLLVRWGPAHDVHHLAQGPVTCKALGPDALCPAGTLRRSQR